MTLDEIIAEYLVAVERGQAPDPADWLARHPEQAGELAVFLADLGRFGSFLGVSHQTSDLTVPFVPAEMPAGEPFGGYELLGTIGQGGMGTVYRARLTGTTLVVALKRVRAQGQFRTEIESCAGLQHPHIVPVYHVGEQAGEPYYTMALIENGSLDRHLARYQSDPEAAVRLVVKVARAVHYAHQRRILHRDLKPANILLDEAGEPRVADFGLAARLNEAGSATDAGPPAGSLPWMAPEAVRGEATLTTAVDVWAVGVILYELLTGDRPFDGATVAEVRAAILEREPVPPRQVNPQVPRDLEAICLRCLARDPEHRYESASAVALDLERWLQGEEVRARPLRPGQRLIRRLVRHPEIVIGVALVVGVLGAALYAGLALAQAQEAALCNAVCHSNEYAARHVAGTVLTRLGQLGDEVVRTADELVAACRAQNPPAASAALANLGGTAPFTTAFVQDEEGFVRSTWPPGGVNIDRPFAPRDYHEGALRHAGRKGRARVHVSRVFVSTVDGRDKIALSVAFYPHGADARPWVLSATLTTDATLGLNALHDDEHKSALLAPRDTNPVASDRTVRPPGYVILVHHAFTPGTRSVSLPLGPVPEPDGWPELVPAGTRAPFPQDTNYRDPVVAGRWLTGSARVGNTELVILVQQNYADAVALHQGYFRRVLWWAAGSLGVALVAFVLVRFARRRR